MTGPLEIPRYGTVRKQTMRKEELLALWTDIRQRTSLPVITGELVTGLRALPDGSWAVVASGGERRAANVVLALGRRGAPRKLDVPGEDLSKVHYRLLEPEPFEGAHVLVVGGGDSAVESAIALAELGRCASVTISYRRSAFARCRDANKRRIDALVARGVVRTALPSDVVRIDDATVTLRRGSREAPIPNDAVIVQAGGTSPAEILSSFGIETITKRGET
ncbi:MAG: NAD(P)-binding domain-containing protein [Deltaproteobacteria bacterium]|nr:NAD(P)-binding domain-containing protein [Deltaproteobacteria bacterium]